MPPLPDVPSVLRVDLRISTAPGLEAGSRFFLGYTGSAPSSATCTTLAADIEGQFNTHLLSLLSNDRDLVAVKVTDLSSMSGGVGVWSGSLNGTRTGAQPPLQISADLTFEIARRYRGGKPKMFTAFGLLADLTEPANAWQPAFLSALVTGWGAFQTALAGLTVGGTVISGQVNVSYYSGFTVVTNPSTGRSRNVSKLRAGGPVVDPVTGFLAQNRTGSQRRRRSSTT